MRLLITLVNMVYHKNWGCFYDNTFSKKTFSAVQFVSILKPQNAVRTRNCSLFIISTWSVLFRTLILIIFILPLGFQYFLRDTSRVSRSYDEGKNLSALVFDSFIFSWFSSSTNIENSIFCKTDLNQHYKIGYQNIQNRGS